ncbi:MAG: hypothetical protein IKN65_02145 [Clostridia bacterium]|nr:hypothetical protein [Clostridia bacterium]
MKKVKSKIEKLDIILVFLLLILIIVFLSIYVKTNSKVDENTSEKKFTVVKESEKQQITVPQTDEEIIKKLSTQGEWDRMDYYCGVYFKHLAEKEYESAYNLLYSEFKEKYFPTLETFREYVEKTYPNDFSWVDDDITRQGNIYVLKVKLLDTKGTKDNEKSQRIVLKENNYNDFVISFQVI